MTRIEKRIFAVFCTVLLILAGGILLRYYKQLTRQNPEISAASEDVPTGYHYTSTGSKLTQNENAGLMTPKRTFSHSIYSQDGAYFTDITVTVTGNVSTTECTISHLSTALSEEQANILTFSEHISGDTATVILYQNQISICHFQYRLSLDGTIQAI